MKVSRDQFDLTGDKLTHTPTGTTFWVGEKDVVICEWGTAGSGDYDREEIRRAAEEIFRADKTTFL